MSSMGTVYDLERNRALGIDTESLLAKNRKMRAALEHIAQTWPDDFAAIYARAALKE